MDLSRVMGPFAEPLGSAARAFPFAAAAIALPFAVWHYRRHGHVHPWRAFLGYSFVFYLIAAAFLVILPLPDLPPDSAKSDWNASYASVRKPQLNPLGFVEYIRSVPPGMLRTLAIFQAAFNVLLLMPFAFFLVYLFRIPVFLAGLSGFLLSFLFELCQLTGLFWIYPGPYRLFDLGDLILNTAGAFIGAFVTVLFVRFRILPDLYRLKRPDTPWIGVFRRGTSLVFDGIAVLAGSLSVSLAGDLVRPGLLPFDLCVGAGIAFWLVILPSIDGGRSLGKRLTFCALLRRNGRKAGFLRLFVRQAAGWTLPILAPFLGRVDGLPSITVPLVLTAWLALAAVNAAGSVLGKEHESWIDRKLGTRIRNTWKADGKLKARRSRKY
ncbi:MAG: hypothetical protein A2Z99_13445 [Treponema sp. GWB1_62_6]|nr:MAG: hypothetical protein A2Y36_18570 [Treponema sp. GWA1_62_8]OHE67614.1 MAG: hypothetical protein A2001_19685 [Treponema sp. GWC1_61_84]OHE70014.1 MAG: hypothetical protein A2Z99_13445 [Treponema sp. GWB1_62_6]OHE70528.1 MAG: hypothetical protein A2413_19345 [Treponema sp. RIFOXYC1_FULL_61_9]